MRRSEEELKEELRRARKRLYWIHHGTGYGWRCKYYKNYRATYRRALQRNEWFVIMGSCLNHKSLYKS